MKKIIKKDTFNFFNYKWKKVPTWSTETEKKLMSKKIDIQNLNLIYY